MTLAYAIIFIISLVGNLMMIHVISKTSYLKTTTNLLVANMAMADLMITFFAMPYSVKFLFSAVWISGTFGEVSCKIVQYLLALAIAASILTHVIIALDRFFCTMYLFKRVKAISNPKKTFPFIWLTSLALMSPYLFFYGSVQATNATSYCIVNFEHLHAIKIYFSLVFFLLYFVPLLAIATMYAFICRRLWRNKAPGILSESSVQRREAHKKKTTKMLVVLVTAFALCWLPAHVMHLLSYFWYDAYVALPLAVMLLSFWACHSHSAINPLLVASLNGKFRKACRQMATNLLYREADGAPNDAIDVHVT